VKNHIYSDGLCPECIQQGLKHIFQENITEGYWECPNCRLQLQMLAPNYLGIIEERGEGLLKDTTYIKEKWGERILLRRPLYAGDDCIIRSTDELNDFLESIK